MPLVTTPAVVLHAFKYGETSKIVRLLTRELGTLSAIAKGASRPKSRFGARLEILSDGVAQLYVKPTRDLQTLSDFDVAVARTDLARDLNRYAPAMALAELVLRASPDEPDPETYDHVVHDLDAFMTVPADRLEAVALTALWRVVRSFGFTPALDGCARDGRRLSPGACAFSVADGGFLCDVCAAQTHASRLEAGDRATLERLIGGDADVGPVTGRHAAAHRRLLSRFVHRHMAEDRELKAMVFWETQR